MTTDRNTVLDPSDSSYVLPLPSRTASEAQGHGEVIVVGGAQARSASLLRGQAVARALGERFQVQADSLQLFLDEVRQRLEQLDASIAEDTRAQLKGAVREIGSVVDWCGAVQTELAYECSQALQGHEPIDVAELCRELAISEQVAAAPITVIVDREVTWWGNAAALVHLIQQALVLVSERTQGSGTRCIELKNDDGVPCVYVRSRGEPADTVDPATVDRFRASAAQLHATVVPDDLGAGGAGMILRLPV